LHNVNKIFYTAQVVQESRIGTPVNLIDTLIGFSHGLALDSKSVARAAAFVSRLIFTIRGHQSHEIST